MNIDEFALPYCFLFTFYGYKNGCSYCGKKLTKKYTFSPFTSPMIHGCIRDSCIRHRDLKRETCIQLATKVNNYLKKISDLEKQQKQLGWLFDRPC